PKDHVKDLLDVNSSGESPETHQGMTQILRHKLLASALLRPDDALPQGGHYLAEPGSLPLTCHKGWLSLAKRLARKAHQSRDQVFPAEPSLGGYRESIRS